MIAHVPEPGAGGAVCENATIGKNSSIITRYLKFAISILFF
jgi:hypothetical protein